MQKQEFQQRIKQLEGICSRKAKQIEKLEMDFHEILDEQYRTLEEIIEAKRELKEREAVIRQMTVKNTKIKGLLRDQRVDLSELKARKNIKQDLKVLEERLKTATEEGRSKDNVIKELEFQLVSCSSKDDDVSCEEPPEVDLAESLPAVRQRKPLSKRFSIGAASQGGVIPDSDFLLNVARRSNRRASKLDIMNE